MTGEVTGSEWVTVTEAVKLLGKSERTIRRWMAKGRLPSRSEGRSVLVDVTGERQAQRHDTPVIEPDTDRLEELSESIKKLYSRVQRLTKERDRLKADLEMLAIQRDTLEVRLQETQEERDQWRGQAAALTQNQRLLAERTGRRFRWPWESRGEE